MKRTIIIALLLFASSMVFGQQGVADKVANLLKAGNATGLAAHFNTNIDLVVLDTDNVYSRQQASAIVQKFFDKHPPKSFKIIHQGSSAKTGVHYFIGTLTTAKGTYRVSYNIKKVSGKFYVQQLHIEDSNDDF